MPSDGRNVTLSTGSGGGPFAGAKCSDGVSRASTSTASVSANPKAEVTRAAGRS